VVNETALRPVLRDHGFAVVRPEEWSLREQVATFATAEAVCGPHGAGLLNAVYGPDAALLELFGARTNPCFYAVAAGLDRRYAAHRATAAGDHLRVAPDRLAALLGLLDGQSRSSADSK
jgi:capsular polysaccharide biosynthesis protein